jgi:hypothetical protein
MESELDASNPEVDWEFLNSPPDWFLKLSGYRKALVEANPANMFDVSVSRYVICYNSSKMTVKLTKLQ